MIYARIQALCIFEIEPHLTLVEVHKNNLSLSWRAVLCFSLLRLPCVSKRCSEVYYTYLGPSGRKGLVTDGVLIGMMVSDLMHERSV